LNRVTIIVPPPIRQFVGGNSRVIVEATTVREALAAVASGSGTLRGYLFDENERLRRFVRVFVNGKPTTLPPGQEEAVSEGSEVTILLALAGG
jgi:molybdopterin converting factor small subunit